MVTSIGERLRAERERLGLNQTVFAQGAGCQKRAQIHYERGERSPDAEYLARAHALGADVFYILTGQRQDGGPRFDDLARLRLAIEAVEEGLAAAGKRLPPDRKAEVIAAAYELLRQHEQEQGAREHVVQLLRLVA
jgi:transcriptional regulator with XRE-family HTH domain